MAYTVQLCSAVTQYSYAVMENTVCGITLILACKVQHVPLFVMNVILE